MCFGHKAPASLVPLSEQEARRLKREYHVTQEEIDKCWVAFQRMDTLGTGCLELEDLFHVLNLEKTYLLEFFFDAIGFREGVRLQHEKIFDPLFTFMMLWRKEVYQILFEQLDTDKEGWIRNDELRYRLCKFMAKDSFDNVDKKVKACIEAADADKNDRIVFTEFVVLCGKLPRLFHPVFEFQRALQEATLGANEWAKKVEIVVKAATAKQEALYRAQHPHIDHDTGEAAKFVDRSMDDIEELDLPNPDRAPKAAEVDAVAKYGGRWKARKSEELDSDSEESDQHNSNSSKSGADANWNVALGVGREDFVAQKETIPKAKERLMSMFSRAADETESFLHRDPLARTPLPEQQRQQQQQQEEEGDTTHSKGEPQQSGTLGTLSTPQTMEGDAPLQSQLDRLYDEARVAVNNDNAQAKKRRRDLRQGMPEKAAPTNRQQREVQRKLALRRKKLINRVKVDIHERDVKNGLIPTDEVYASQPGARTKVKAHVQSRASAKVVPTEGKVASRRNEPPSREDGHRSGKIKVKSPQRRALESKATIRSTEAKRPAAKRKARPTNNSQRGRLPQRPTTTNRHAANRAGGTNFQVPKSSDKVLAVRSISPDVSSQGSSVVDTPTQQSVLYWDAEDEGLEAASFTKLATTTPTDEAQQVLLGTDAHMRGPMATSLVLREATRAF